MNKQERTYTILRDRIHSGSFAPLERLNIDALVGRGDEDAIAARVRAHHDAGADHVCIYVVGGTGEELPLDAWRRLAPALTGLG